MAAQLPLGIKLRDSATFANLVPGPNAEAVAQLQSAATAGQCLYLWGGAGTGKTHLLQAACHAAAGRGLAAAYLPLASAERLTPDFLDGLEALALVCVDDIQAVAGTPAWEQALFHLYNRLCEGGRRLIVTGDRSPRGLDLRLPDLLSRLGWGLVFQLQALDDEHKAEALELRARARGIELAEGVARYLMRRCPRDTGALFALLERLDEASLAAQRRLTIPFVREVLGEGGKSEA